MSSTVGTSSSQIGDLEVLLQWSSADPVGTFEMRRNDRIHAAWQGNSQPVHRPPRVGCGDLELSSLESVPHVHPLPLRPLGIAPEPFEMGGVVYGSVLGVSPVGATSVPGISPRATRPTSA